MSQPTNILFSGVGGQGIILASDITSLALIKSGLDVKKSEIHGMAQRGGSVVAHLRYGKKVYSPIIEPGTADMQVSFEMLESLRYLPLLKKNSAVILNTQKIPPLSVSTGLERYPPNVMNELYNKGLDVIPVDALGIASSTGELRSVNMVLVGVLSSYLPVKEEIWNDIIAKKVKEQYLEVNMEAFGKGRELIKSSDKNRIFETKQNIK